MANVFIEEQYMEDIGDAIRNRTGKENLIYPENMAEEILSIGAGTNATANHIYKLDTAYVDGEIIKGTMESLGLSGVVEVPNDSGCKINSDSDGAKVLMLAGDTTNTDVRYVEPSSTVITMLYDSNPQISVFGDAKPEDVVVGKKFTSSSGLNISGTVSETASGLVNILDSSDNSVSKGSSGTSSSMKDYIRNKHTFTSNRLYRKGSSIDIGVEASNYGDATVDDVALGKTFTSTAGLKATGIGSHGKYIWERYCIDYIWEYTTGTGTTTKPSDCGGQLRKYFRRTQDGLFELDLSESTYLNGYYIVSGGDGKSIYQQKFVVSSYTSSTYYYKLTITGSTYSGTQKGFLLGYVTSNDENAYPDDGIKGDYWYVKTSVDGIDTSEANATASDIMLDKTAYVNGQLITGTHVCSSGGLTTKTGTTTSGTINTGLSEIVAFMIDNGQTSGTGLTSAICLDGTNVRLVGRSQYLASVIMNQIGINNPSSGTVSINGGTITLDITGNYILMSGKTYNWMAIGN